jgi:hypothetical protein
MNASQMIHQAQPYIELLIQPLPAISKVNPSKFICLKDQFCA